MHHPCVVLKSTVYLFTARAATSVHHKSAPTLICMSAPHSSQERERKRRRKRGERESEGHIDEMDGEGRERGMRQT